MSISLLYTCVPLLSVSLSCYPEAGLKTMPIVSGLSYIKCIKLDIVSVGFDMSSWLEKWYGVNKTKSGFCDKFFLKNIGNTKICTLFLCFYFCSLNRSLVDVVVQTLKHVCYLAIVIHDRRPLQ